MSEIIAAVTPDPATLKALVPLAVPAITATINAWLTPAVSKLLKSREIEKKAGADQLAASFEEYLLRTYARLSFVNTIVFGNQQKRLQDLYIPLTVRSSRAASEVTFKIDSWRSEFVPAIRRVVITDTAGMGKSTILKWLFLCSMGMNSGLPIFIELRTLTKTKKIIDRIHEELCPIDKPFDKELLLHLLRTGTFILFLDGFDEIAFEDRQEVTQDVQSFIGKCLNNLFVIASRHESALASFGEFQEFTIKPLSKEEAFTLLRRYDDTGEHAEALIKELAASKYNQLKDLMTNPMLVSLLFKAYSYKPKVPFKKQIFYRQVFDALFDMHDSTKGGAFVRKKHCELDIDEFHLIMRDLGFTTAKLGKIEYEKDEVCDIIKRVRERNTTVLFQPTALLSDLISTVPLFNKEGNHFKWAHKSVQDYFASQFITVDAKGNEMALLERIYDAGHCRRFENILDMVHDSDNKNFRRVLLAKLLRDYIDHYETTYTGDFENIPSKAIELRKQLSFGYEFAVSLLGDAGWKKFDQHIEKAKKVFLGKKTEPSVMLFGSNNGKATMHAVYAKPAYGLLPLLAARKYPYVARARMKKPDTIAPSKAIANKIYLLDDDPESLLNSAENFSLVNDLLAHHGYLISISDVRRTLKSIEGEADDAAEVNQLLQNL